MKPALSLANWCVECGRRLVWASERWQHMTANERNDCPNPKPYYLDSVTEE